MTKPFPHARSVLFLAFITFAGVISVDAQPTSLPKNSTPEMALLIQMVRSRPLNLAEVKPLAGASFVGDTIRLSSVQVEPLSSNALVDFFDDWRFAARLQLLIDYASWQLAQKEPRIYVGSHAEDYRARDREADLRIATLVREAGYHSEWKPFVAVYQDLLQAVTDRALVLRKETGGEDPFAILPEVDRITRLHLEGVIEEYPIDPQIVAHEMVRLLNRTREMLGVTSPLQLRQHLFHSCGSGGQSKIVTNGAHPLAPVLFVAWETSDDDKAARQIKQSYFELANAYEGWAAQHPQASSRTQLEHIRALTQQLQVIEQLSEFQKARSLVKGGE